MTEQEQGLHQTVNYTVLFTYFERCGVKRVNKIKLMSYLASYD